jgi:lipoprotein signal peptidase
VLVGRADKRRSRTPENSRRLLAAAVAAVCAAIDLGLKAGLHAELHHPRPIAIVLLSVGLAVALIALVPRLPSRTASFAAGLGAGGASGNAIAAIAWSGGVPDPLALTLGGAGLAFNFADVLALVGTLILLGAAAAYVIRHPGSLREPL